MKKSRAPKHGPGANLKVRQRRIRARKDIRTLALVQSQRPDSAPALPDSAPALPDSAPALPDSAPALPDSAPALPDSAPALPDSAPALPDSNSEEAHAVYDLATI